MENDEKKSRPGKSSKVKRTKKSRDNYSQVYQFKISLQYIKPLIWRRIQVPGNYTFWDLHVAIQNVMGWTDSHLHQFILRDPLTKQTIFVGQIDDEFPSDLEILLEGDIKIQKWFSPGRKHAIYEYDMGDDWLHQITLEKTLPREEKTRYPRCLGGARACPPEDCGSYPGYEELVKGNEEFKGDFPDYDPEHFDINKIEFEDPDEHLELMNM